MKSIILIITLTLVSLTGCEQAVAASCDGSHILIGNGIKGKLKLLRLEPTKNSKLKGAQKDDEIDPNGELHLQGYAGKDAEVEGYIHLRSEFGDYFKLHYHLQSETKIGWGPCNLQEDSSGDEYNPHRYDVFVDSEDGHPGPAKLKFSLRARGEPRPQNR